MADPFIGEIRIVAFDFAPEGWAFCDGQVLPRAQNNALFEVLGFAYGGSASSSGFALPDLRGRAAVGAGAGPGLTQRDEGHKGGEAGVELSEAEMPAHGHTPSVMPAIADSQSPSPTRRLARSQNANAYRAPTSVPEYALADEALATTGAGQPHNNMQPFLTFNFVIALQGVNPHPW